MQVSSSNRSLIKRIVIRVILSIFLGFSLVCGLPLLIQYFSPFIFAILLAALANPLVNKIDGWLRHLKIKSSTSRSLVTFFLTIFILFWLFLTTYLVFSTLLQEILDIAASVQNNWESIVKLFENTERWIAQQIDILPPEVLEIMEEMTENILEFIRNISRNLINYTVSFTGFLISKGGSLTLNLLTFFLSLYFLMSDFDRLKLYIKNHTDLRLLKTATLLKNTIIVGVGGYIKTQFILAFVAFGIMFTAFTLYGHEYALTIAILLAIIDIIPLLGTIAVLLPWGIFEVVFGTLNFGIFLIILGVSYFLFRRLVEPKVMGRQTGLHPLFALIGIYVGIQFSGLWGALLGPLFMVVLIGILRSGLLDNTLADIRELYYKTLIYLERKN